ncbi:MAG: hypothetical protein FWD82_03105 [Defluviitaleaceae bacterium]|nr:hypothetical protein [Defluviitaleaceae bacterium]
MRKNVFVKSMFRQIVKSILLMVIIAIVAFAFVLRATEYILVRNQIEGIANSYNTIGFLQGRHSLDDISDGARAIGSSPHVRLEQQRRTAEGVMQGVLSGDVAGMNMAIPFEQQNRQSISMIIGTLIDVWTPPDNQFWEWAWLFLRVEEVFAGFPEHGAVGHNVWISIHRETYENFGFEDMEIGERYFMKGGRQYNPSDFFGMPSFPRIHNSDNNLRIMPLNESDNLWFVNLLEGEELDFTREELIPVAEDLAFLRHNQSAVHLQTVIDMELMHIFNEDMRPPFSTPDYDPFNTAGRGVMAGRLIDENDYINANPVAVIDRYFARNRGLVVGDTLTITVSRNQHISGIYSIPTEAGMFSDFVVRSEIGDEDAYTIELEIVGIVFHRLSGIYQVSPMFVYIPDSVLPQDVVVSVADGLLPIDIHDEYLIAHHYSFVLESTKHEQEFFLNYREMMDIEHDIELVMLWSGIGNFWVYAEAIILMVTFNTIVVSIVLVFVLALVAFLFLQQRRRDFAILRALGLPIHNIYRKLFVSILFVGLPPMIIGGIVAYNFAISQASDTLSSLGDMVSGFEANAVLPIHLIALLIAVVFVTLLIMIFVGAGYIVRRPVLEMLQGIFFKPRQKKKEKNEIKDTEEVSTNLAKLSNYNLPDTKKSKIKNSLRFVFKHIGRSPVRSVLGIVIAFSFIVALGWISESIVRTEAEIDNIYISMSIDAEIVQEESRAGHRDRILGDVILPRTVHTIRNSEFTTNVNYQANWSSSFIIAPEEDGSFPENWVEEIGYYDNLWIRHPFNIAALDNAIGIGSVENFINDHTDTMLNGIMGSLSIEFLEGFDLDDFYYQDRTGVFSDGRIVSMLMGAEVYNIDAHPVPIIVSQSTLEARGISLGDTVYFVYRDWAPALWFSVPAVVVGVHNEHISGAPGLQQSFLVSAEFLEITILGGLGYNVLTFSINPEFNRQHLEEPIFVNASGWLGGGLIALRIFVFDEMLRNTIGAMNQTLTLLELLQPVIAVLAVSMAAGLAVLLTLQFAKNVAIMRVLGASKRKACIALCIEQLVLCLFGIILALLFLIIMGWVAVFTLSALYFAGVFVGTLIGAVLVTKREPLELLQVRE